MASEDFLIRIVLDAQSKIAPVMAAAAAEAKKLQSEFDKADNAASGLGKRMDQLEGHVSKARDTLRSMNPTLDATNRKLKDLNPTIAMVNNSLGKLDTKAEEAAGALGALSVVIEEIEEKLQDLGHKMEELGARTFSPKVEVEGTEEGKEKVDALALRLLALERKRRTVRIGIEREILDKEIASVEAKLEKLGDEGVDVYIRVKESVDDETFKLRDEKARESTNKFLADEAKKQEAQRKTSEDHIGQLARLARQSYKDSTPAELDSTLRQIEAVRTKMRALNQEHEAERVLLGVQYEQQDKLGKIADKNEQDRQAKHVRDVERSYERISASVNKAARDKERAEAAGRAASDKSDREAEQQRISRLNRRVDSFSTAQKDYADDSRPVRSFKVDRAEFERARAELIAEAKASGVDVPVGVKLSHEDLAFVHAELAKLGLKRETVKVLLDYDRNDEQRTLSRISNFFSQAAEKADVFNSSGGGKGGLFTSSGLTTAAIRAAAVFAEPLLSALTAVGGALVAVAVAAGQAATGLVGLAVAGAAQAVPVIGLLALAFSRVTAVMKVAQLAQAERDKGNQQGAAVDNARANALDGLKSAQDGVRDAIRGVADAERNLADAQRRVREAQEGLNEARKEGLRVIEDAILAERRASLAAKSSELAMATGIATGSGALAQSAQIDVDSSKIDARRQRQDTGALVAGGVDATPGVVSAKKNLEDALRGVDNAQRSLADANRAVDKARDGVDKAQRSLAQAADKMGAAANAYDIALKKLSSGERTLLQSIENFKKIFAAGSALRDISDIIVKSFARALDDVAALLNDSTVIRSFQKLASAIADTIDDLAKFLTTGPMRQALVFFSDEATSNIGVVGEVLQNLISIFTNVAQAASGPFASALRSVNNWLEGLADKTSPAKAGGMRDFFQKSLEPLRSFARLGGSLINLFLALAGPGGATTEGTRGIDNLTASINRATKYVQTHGEEVQKFFHDSIDAVGDVGRVLVGIGKFLVDTFDPASVKAFADFLIGIIFPVLTKIVQVLGFFVRGMLSVFNNEYVGGIAKVAAELAIFLAVVFAVERAVLVMASRFVAWAAASVLIEGALAALRLVILGVRIAFFSLLLGNPFAWVALGIAALVALYLKFDGFRNVVNSVLSWVREHWKVLGAILLGPFGLALLALSKFGPKLISALSGPFKDLKDFVAGAVKVIFSPFSGIFDTIVGWAKTAFDKIKDIFNAIKGVIPDIGGSIDDQINKAEAKAKAAYDKRQAERKAAQDAYNRAGASELKGSGYRPSAQSGGDVPRAAIAITGGTDNARRSQPTAKKTNPFDLGDFGAVDSKITPQEAAQIKKLWNDIESSAAESTGGIAKSVRDMRVAIEDTLDRLVRIAKTDFGDFWDAGRKNFANLDTSIEHSMDQVTKTITSAMGDIAKAFYDGFKYIVDTTNESLKAFDATPARITITAPRAQAARKAVGGFIGQAGERGRDAVHTVLGRGEAVLNSTQQFMVNAAMSGRDSLDSIFNRTRGYHAGGADDGMGFAQGGYTGPFGSGAAFTPIANFAKAKFGLTMTAGKDNHSTLTASGNVSDHSRGWAGDFSNGVLTPQEDAFNSFIKRRLPQIVKQLIWRNKDQFQGFPIPDHEDHVHLAVKPELAINGARMAKILQGASRGLDISSLLAGLGSGATGTINADHVDAPKVGGPKGNQRNLATSVLARATKAANDYIDKKANKLNAGLGDGKINEADIRGALGGREVFDFFTSNGFKPYQAAAFVGNFVQESGLVPSVIQPNGEGHGLGQWGGGRFSALQAFAKQRDTSWTDGKTQLAFVMHELQTSESAAFKSIKASRNLAEAVTAVGRDYERFGIEGNRLGPAAQALRAYGSQPGNPGHATGGYAWGGFQANGGDYMVDKPTLFVAGEAGKERATFTPANSAGLGADVGKLIAKDISDSLKDPIKLLANELKEFRNYTKLDKQGNANAGNVAGILGVLDDVQDSMGNITLRGKKALQSRVTKLGNALDFFASDEGPLAIVEAQIQARTQALTNSLQRRQYRVTINRRGRVTATRGLQDPATIGRAEINALGEARQGLEGEDDSISRALRRARTGLSKATTQKQRNVYNQAINNLVDKQSAVRDALAQNAQSIVERAEQMQQDLLDKATTGFDRQRTTLEQIRRINTAFGRGDDNNALFSQQIKIAQDQIADLLPRLSKAQSTGNETLAKSIQDTINELVTTMIEAANQQVQAITDTVTSESGRRSADIDRFNKVAEMFGVPGATASKNQQLVDNANLTIQQLQAPLQQAIDNGNQRQVDDIRDQITDLQNSILEFTVASIQSQIDEVNKAADRRDFATGIQNRLLDLQARAGDALGALRGRADTLAQTGDTLRFRRDGLQNQLNSALALGDATLANELADKIADLNTSIKENEQSIRENTDQVRKLSVDIVTGAQNRATGLLGSVQTINNNIAALNGSDTTAQTLSVLQSTAAVLQTAAQGLVREAQGAVGANEFGDTGTSIISQLLAGLQQGPQEFANVLQTLAPVIAEFEKGLGPDALAAFQSIIDGLVGNTTAITDNTNQIKQLSGTMTQSFSSTGWTTFRAAILDGNGGLLPQYDTPQAMNAGTSTNFSNTTGSNSNASRMAGNIKTPNMDTIRQPDYTEVNVTTPMEVLDPHTIGEKIAYAKLTRGRL